MELILNINQYNYEDFLLANVDSFIIALETFSSGFSQTYSISEIPEISKDIKGMGKKLYLSLNTIANEEIINKLEKEIPNLKQLNCDGFVVSDFGILQLFKEHNLLDKVVFNPITTITNKYSCAISNNLGIHHTCVANELNIKDILEIAKHTNGNMEILGQGYYQICNSKRPLITNYFKNFKLVNSSPYFYIQEETRDYAYPIIEIDNEVFVYTDKQRCALPYLKEILKSNIKYLRLDTIFLDRKDVFLIIDIYKKAINNPSCIEELIPQIKETNSNLNSLNTVSVLKKEGK